ncbi:hypothetical protein JW930_01450 [Candidatus Woesearchaeota archaeon]|nr:hypothetical protein [Candidatus Woesearchaeota archaeon]
MNETIQKNIKIAEKRILELTKAEDLKKISEKEKYQISTFYENKSKNRLETARIIYNLSKDQNKPYKDYAEVVSAAYYSMYYIVHAFLALKYKRKLRTGIRGVHAITQQIILYYLVKTKRIAKHLYEDYLTTFETTAEIQNLSIEDFQEKAYEYARKYEKSRSAREIFTYNTTVSIEEYHAEQAINRAEEFISTIREVMISK